MTERNNLIEIKELSFWYEEAKIILDRINLEIGEGERVGILGPNGTGKTTLFLLLAGITKPQKGHIYLDGKEVTPGKFNPQIGMVFQDSNDQIVFPTVAGDIAFGPRNLGLSIDEVENRVNEALSRLNISHLSKRAPHHLSGGEKRLVSIAGSILAMHCRIAFYDEPTSNLDTKYRRLLINFIKESPQDTVLVASHDLEFVMEVCNRVIIMNHGRIVADGRPEKILSQPELLEQHSLEVPYSLLGKTQGPQEVGS